MPTPLPSTSAAPPLPKTWADLEALVDNGGPTFLRDLMAQCRDRYASIYCARLSGFELCLGFDGQQNRILVRELALQDWTRKSKYVCVLVLLKKCSFSCVKNEMVCVLFVGMCVSLMDRIEERREWQKMGTVWWVVAIIFGIINVI